MHARIMTVNRDYCHAQNRDGRYFVHCSDCDFTLAEARVGDVIDIGEIEWTERGGRARNVRWVERPAGAVDSLDDVTEGFVCDVLHHRGFAFMRPDDRSGRQDDVLLHITEFADYDGQKSPTFEALGRGARVRCARRRETRGWRGERIELVL